MYEAHAKMKRALDLQDVYEVLPDNAHVEIVVGNCSYELYDGEEGPRLTIADLRAVLLERND